MKLISRRPFVACLIAIFLGSGATMFAAAELPVFSEAAIVAPGELSGPEKKAVTVLVEEIEKRTTLRLPVSTTLPVGENPVVLVTTRAHLAALHLPDADRASLPVPPEKPEAFAIRLLKMQGRDTLAIIGQDARGMLFGIGDLLRQMRLRPGRIELVSALDVSTAPRMRWRGHQLGYRPKTNSYDGWDVQDWDQYIRDLVIFGVNAIELVPPRSDDAATSPHFPLPPLRMMQAMSQIAADYGIECWIWFPAIDKDYTTPEAEKKALDEWGEVFRALPRIDAVFVPGGDPGRTPPAVLMHLLESQATNLHRFHPQAAIWVSPQGFNAAWLKEWVAIVAKKPAWFSGVAYGPWTRMSLPELRAAVPAEYPLRLYPDITHSHLCQYPVPDWDSALANTLGREPINPRPEAMANILRRQLPYADGFISYSEGCNDDVNKTIWSALSWNPDADVSTVLREYARTYLSPQVEQDFAHGLVGLEQNWRGPLLTNENVDATLRWFQGMERTATPRLLHNWRFLQGLYRAYFDAYERRRLIREKAEEQQALGLLANAPRTGALGAVSAAESVLFASPPDPQLAAWRTRIFQLAEALFQTAKMQLSVPLYQAIAVERGANLDALDLPLNDRGWLGERFAEVRALPKETDRLAAIQRVVDWQNPGPGGYYDDLGDATAQPHLVANSDPIGDPEFRSHSITTHTPRNGIYFENWRAAWWDHCSAFYGSAVELAYRDLDPAAHYRVRVVYVPAILPAEIQLEANGKYPVHAAQNPGKARSGESPHPREFDIPDEATREGHLRLRWTADPNAGDLAGFGQIGEVWLIKSPATDPATGPRK